MLRRVFLVALVWFFPLATSLWGWGSQVHQQINARAVDLLPDVVGSFFQAHKNWLVALSTEPDQRRRYDRSGAPHHYIDLEYFGESPFSDIPSGRQAAVDKYGEDNLQAWGSLPWHAAGISAALRDAFKQGEWERAIVLAAELGHFIADGHQPLHTTVNYDGQNSDNDGIHGLFETHMVNRFLEDYRYTEAELETIADPATSILRWLVDAHGNIAELLQADSRARASLTRKDKKDLTGGYSAREMTIPPQYLDQLYAGAGELAWSQISLATVRLASLWYWAWVQAGKPVPP